MQGDGQASVADHPRYGPYRLECPECDWSPEPNIRPTATWMKGKHRRRVGHEAEIVAVEGRDAE